MAKPVASPADHRAERRLEDLVRASADMAMRLAAVTERLHAACLTVACLTPDGPAGFFSTWPAFRRDWWDWGNEASKLSDADIARRLLAPPRFTPTPAQVDDCLPALDLLRGEARQVRCVIAARAQQLWYDLDGGWRAVGRAAGTSHEGARKIHWGATVRALSRTIDPRTL